MPALRKCENVREREREREIMDKNENRGMGQNQSKLPSPEMVTIFSLWTQPPIKYTLHLISLYLRLATLHAFSELIRNGSGVVSLLYSVTVVKKVL